MTTAPAQQLSLADTPYYHAISRCVRRAYLYGTDELTEQCCEYQQTWAEDRNRLLSTIFANKNVGPRPLIQLFRHFLCTSEERNELLNNSL